MSKSHVSLVAQLTDAGMLEAASTIEQYEEENAKLREQLAAVEDKAAEFAQWHLEAAGRAEAAEAKLKAASEQDPGREWLKTEISAIDCRYRGDPSYNHDAYWMREQVVKFIDKNKHIIDRAQTPPADVQQMEVSLALYKADAERIWAMMPELRDTDYHYELFEAVQEAIAQAREEGRKAGRRQFLTGW